MKEKELHKDFSNSEHIKPPTTDMRTASGNPHFTPFWSIKFYFENIMMRISEKSIFLLRISLSIFYILFHTILFSKPLDLFSCFGLLSKSRLCFFCCFFVCVISFNHAHSLRFTLTCCLATVFIFSCGQSEIYLSCPSSYSYLSQDQRP